MNSKFQNAQTIDIDKMRRILAVIVAIVVWCFSMKFSVGGFGDGVSKKDAWMGWVLAACITAIQLIWNGQKEKTNLTMFGAGLFSYIYGISTNVLGILFWQGNTIESAMNNPIQFAFPVIFGIFIEVIPEPMAVWGFTNRHDEGDFFGNLFGNKMIPRFNDEPQKPNKPSQHNQQPTQQRSMYQPQNKPTSPNNIFTNPNLNQNTNRTINQPNNTNTQKQKSDEWSKLKTKKEQDEYIARKKMETEKEKMAKDSQKNFSRNEPTYQNPIPRYSARPEYPTQLNQENKSEKINFREIEKLHNQTKDLPYNYDFAGDDQPDWMDDK